MCKEISPDDIAEGKDVCSGRAKIVINLDAFCRVVDTDGVQIQPIYIRLTTCREQNLICLKHKHFFALFHRHTLLVSPLICGEHTCICNQSDPFRLKYMCNRRGYIGIFAW